MNAKVLLFQILSIILIYVEHLKAQCNVCSAVNQMVCVSQTEYQFCVNNMPSGAVNTCPTDYVCSTATATICLPNSAGVTATCSDCNKCDLSLVFACTGVSTYALCLGQTTPSAVTGTCGAGQVCNINSAQICTTPSAGLTATVLLEDQLLRLLLQPLRQRPPLLRLPLPCPLMLNIFAKLCVLTNVSKFLLNLIHHVEDISTALKLTLALGLDKFTPVLVPPTLILYHFIAWPQDLQVVKFIKSFHKFRKSKT
ncbi:uncharacterized protein LOC119609759 isoform X2 [Lucilia sericata]|uniref:uncharacterized protein LOC119609759 isoform X2 n=1 Tax=Lucilia sericata TaxID=13632 RepID=UPI0018A81938|nr:uncharacterized protein LOC119609759 isoform X2 [Lucilia sericata]